MNELLREIEDDIRRERFDKLWYGFGRIMVGVSIVVILFTIGMVVMQNRKQAHDMEMTSEFIKGTDRLNIEDYKGAVAVFGALADSASSPYYGLSMLRKAQAEAALSDRAAATKAYQDLAANDPVLGAVARMLAAPNDTLPPPAKNTPFYYAQSEWRGWQLMQQGKKEEAVAQFLALYLDTAAPASVHERLSEVLRHIAPEKIPSETVATVTVKDTPHE